MVLYSKINYLLFAYAKQFIKHIGQLLTTEKFFVLFRQLVKTLHANAEQGVRRQFEETVRFVCRMSF